MFLLPYTLASFGGGNDLNFHTIRYIRNITLFQFAFLCWHMMSNLWEQACLSALHFFNHLLIYFETFDWMLNFSMLSNKHHWCIFKNNPLLNTSCTTFFPVYDFSSHSPHIFIHSGIKGLTLFSRCLRCYSYSNFCTKLHNIKRLTLGLA